MPAGEFSRSNRIKAVASYYSDSIIAIPRCWVPHPFHSFIVKRVGDHAVGTPSLELL
jgi:hypothetical protein